MFLLSIFNLFIFKLRFPLSKSISQIIYAYVYTYVIIHLYANYVHNIIIKFNPLTPVFTLLSHSNDMLLVESSSTVRRQRVKRLQFRYLKEIIYEKRTKSCKNKLYMFSLYYNNIIIINNNEERKEKY